MRQSADNSPENRGQSRRPQDDDLSLLSPTERAIRKAQAEGQFDNLQGEGRPAKVPPPLLAKDVDTLVEQRIQKAMEEGQFDNLQGTGQPLDLWDDMYVPDEHKMAFRLLKAQGLKPPWIELRQEWEQEWEQYTAWRDKLRGRWQKLAPLMREKMRQEARLRVSALNSLIHNINATVPSDSLRLGLLVYERELNLLSGEA